MPVSVDLLQKSLPLSIYFVSSSIITLEFMGTYRQERDGPYIRNNEILKSDKLGINIWRVITQKYYISIIWLVFLRQNDHPHINFCSLLKKTRKLGGRNCDFKIQPSKVTSVLLVHILVQWSNNYKLLTSLYLIKRFRKSFTYMIRIFNVKSSNLSRLTISVLVSHE